MPTFDGGHCFLTALLPISTAYVVDKGQMKSSPVHMVREALASLPIAHQTPFTLTGPDSPFAFNKTHFARLAVIDDIIYNGRTSADAIVGRANPAIPQPVDQLSCPYLMFVVDFDAPEGKQSEVLDYLRELWTHSGKALNPIFSCCHGFAQRPGDPNFITDAETFAKYVVGYQIETTMPFNDYWPGIPPLKDPVVAGLSLSLERSLAAVAVAALALGVLFYCALDRVGLFVKMSPWVHCIEVLAISVLAIAVPAFVAYRLLMWRASKPFPTAPGSDLPSVLKALYLQRAFTGFAIKAQGMDDADLHREFGQFLADTQPGKPQPTQAAGVIPV